MRYLPCDELVEVLAPAFKPSDMLADKCRCLAKWDPARGFVPRGFIGALGSLEDVEVVIIVAEPANPLPGENYVPWGDPVAYIEAVCRSAYKHLEKPAKAFHSNLRHLLNCIYPEMSSSLPDQLRRVWITESVLCSAQKAAGDVPGRTERHCVDNYLRPQLKLLSELPQVPFGGKAQRRTRRAQRRTDSEGLADGTPNFGALASRRAAAVAEREREEAAQWIRGRLAGSSQSGV